MSEKILKTPGAVSVVSLVFMVCLMALGYVDNPIFVYPMIIFALAQGTFWTTLIVTS
jgi:hypothetical protein